MCVIKKKKKVQIITSVCVKKKEITNIDILRWKKNVKKDSKTGLTVRKGIKK